MRLSQVSFSRFIAVQGLGLKEGLQDKTAGVVSIDRDGDTVTVVTKGGLMTEVPWGACLYGWPIAPSPAKK